MSAALYLFIAAAAMAWLAWKQMTPLPKLEVPRVQFEGDNSMERYISETKSLMDQGYAQYLKKGEPFSIRNPSDERHPLVILPMKYLAEVRNAPQSKLSFPYFLDKLFARIAARVMVGPELCRNEEWLQLALSYTEASMKAIRGVRARYPPSLRFLAQYIDSNTRTVLRHRRHAAQVLRPLLEVRMSEKEESTYIDGIKWLLDVYEMRGKNLSPDQLAQDEFILNVASISSSSAVALSIIYDMIDHPELLEEIREEISRVVKMHTTWTQNSLGELRILDSFMKESLRLHTLQQLTVQRTAMVPWTFKDGFQLPAGTNISFASQQLNLDNDVYPNATTFDAKRFLRKREEIDPNRFHFASVSDDSIVFGAGFHACPGRFLAQDILKLMFVQLLTRYDFKLAQHDQSRPPDIPYNFSIMPNMASQILLKEKSNML
ncbi:hypothetical protein DL769_002013 [Monosporascus sp. CRB-8-3]|nr:hypothetical protein DL769_002013 [Monosporascus sp. CRB-8-3]